MTDEAKDEKPTVEKPEPFWADDLNKAVGILRTVIEHDDQRFHLSLILAAAQDWVIDLLPTVFYLVFSGPPDSGKGTAISAAMAMTKRGVVLGGTSGPYLRDTLNDKVAIGLSETGLLIKQNPDILRI